MFNFKSVSSYSEFKKIFSISLDFKNWKISETDCMEKLIKEFAILWDKKLEDLSLEETVILFEETGIFFQNTLDEIEKIKKKQMMISGNTKNV